MGLVLEYEKVYPPIEQYCKENDLIAEVKVVRDDDNPPHIVYSLNGSPDQDVVYSYVSIDSNTGKIYLTLDGVNAINADYPDNPAQEITELVFQVLAKDIEQGDTLTIDVQVGVVRIHDEPPRIVDEKIYDIYQDDAAEGEIVLDVRTAFPSFFYTTSNYVKIPSTDIGRLVLSADGVDFVKNMDLTDDSIEHALTFTITIQDQKNNLTLEKEFKVPIKPGSALPQIPRKSILENVGQNLGQDLALKIETNRLKIEDLKTLNDILFNESISYETNINNAFYDSFISKSMETNLIEGKDKDGNDFERIYETIQKNLEPVINTLSAEIKENINLLNDNFINTYNEIEKTTNSVNLLNLNLLDYEDDTNIYLETSYKTFLRSIEYAKNYVNDALVLTDKAINYVASEITSELYNFETAFSRFKYVEYCNFKKDTQDRLSDLESCMDGLLDLVCDNGDYYDKDKWCKRDTDEKTILTRISDLESEVADHENRISTLEGYTLENWGVDNKWLFSTSSDIGTLKHNSRTVLTKNSNKLSVGNSSDFDYVYMEVGGKTYTFNSTGLDLGSNKLTAGTCDCTATQAQYADLAEIYDADKDYPIGTIMSVGGEKEVTAFSKINNKLIGIISEKPGFILNANAPYEHKALIGLIGRIRVRSLGPLRKGERVFASEFNGYATNQDTNYFIGYALENSVKQENGEYLTLIFFKGI